MENKNLKNLIEKWEFMEVVYRERAAKYKGKSDKGDAYQILSAQSEVYRSCVSELKDVLKHNGKEVAY